MFQRARQGFFALALLTAAVAGLASDARPVFADGPDDPTIVFSYNASDNSMTYTFYTPTSSEGAVPPAQQAVVLDQNNNPQPGRAVNFFSFDPSQYRPTCATTASLLASGYTFNPIIPGAFPGPAAPPQAGLTPNPGAGVQAGFTTLGAPFPLPQARFNTLQATPLGYLCFSNPFSIIPGSITVLTDATGSAFFSLAPIPQGAP
jgi:hypothetical protein